MASANSEYDSYLSLINRIDGSLNNAARVQVVAKQREQRVMQDINNQAQTQMNQLKKMRQDSQNNYRGIAGMLQSQQYVSIGIQLPLMMRPTAASQTATDGNYLNGLATQHRQLSAQIGNSLRAFMQQAKSEADAAAARRQQAQMLLAARAASMSLQKSEDVKKKPWGLIIGISAAVVVIAVAIICLAFFM